MSNIFTLIGVIVGGFITFLISKKLQDRQFKNDKEKQNSIYRSLLDTLIHNIQDINDRLKNLKQNPNKFNNNFHQHFGFEYFNTDIPKAVIVKLMDVKLFPENKDVFNRIIKLINDLSYLNDKIKIYENLLSLNKRDAGSSNPLQYNMNDILIKIENILVFIESNYGQSQYSIIQEIENIKNKLV